MEQNQNNSITKKTDDKNEDHSTSQKGQIKSSDAQQKTKSQ
jgi:hypothetical protein